MSLVVNYKVVFAGKNLYDTKVGKPKRISKS